MNMTDLSINVGHSKSLMQKINPDDFNFNEKKKEILDKKRYE